MTPLLVISIYILTLSLFLLFFKKRLVFQHFARIFYIALVRTKIGLTFIDALAQRYKKQLFYAQYASIFLGFSGMTFVSFDLIKGFITLLHGPATASVGLVLPFDVKGAVYVPFLYWIISVAVIMIVHEYSHGIFARHHKIPLKATGFAVLGVIVPLVPGAFVDIDEKTLSKKSLFAQLSVFSAGPFANIITAALFFIMLLLITPLVHVFTLPTGVIITEVVTQSPAAITGFAIGEIITNIDGKNIADAADFSHAFTEKKPGDNIRINNKKITLGKNPTNNQPYFGVFVEEKTAVRKAYEQYSVVAGIMLWLFALNIGVGIFNLLPLGPLDGGRMLRTVLCNKLHHRHARHILHTVNITFLVVLLSTIVHSFLA